MYEKVHVKLNAEPLGRMCQWMEDVDVKWIWYANEQGVESVGEL